jgi:PAS domain S-box-containing protein
MKTNKSGLNKYNEIQTRAEKGLTSMIHLSDELSYAEVKQLVNKLQDHQIELEMQNNELRKARTRIEESHKRYSNLYDFAPVGYFTFDDNGLIIDANLTAADQLSIEKSSLIKKSFYQFIHKDDRDIFYLHLKEAYKRKTRRACEIRLYRKDKSEFDAQLVSIAVQDSKGNYSQIRTAISNITEHKQTEAALKESEELHRITLSSISDAVFISDDRGMLRFICPNVDVIFGYSIDDIKAFGNIARLLGDNVFDPEDLEASGEIKNIERNVVDKAGYGHSLLINVKRVSIKGGTVLYTCRDITERKYAEEEQQRLQKRLAAQWELARIVDADHDSICRQILAEIIDMTESKYGFYGFVNADESVMTIHSWSKETIADYKMSEKPIEFEIKKSGIWGNAIRKRKTLIINNYNDTCPHKNGLPEGHAAIHRLISVPILRHDKIVAVGAVANRVADYTEKDAEQMISFLQSAQIIQEKRQSEAELRRHREHLMDLVDERTQELKQINRELEQEICERIHVEHEMKLMALFAELNPSPVLRFGKDGKVLMANPAAVTILNLEPLSAARLPSIIPGIEGLDLAACIRDGSIRSHSALIGDRIYHFIFRGLPDLEIGQIYGSDITEQKHAEAESIRAGQLASIGELAAGVAHEINNPVNGIINYAQILADKTIQGGLQNNAAIEIMKEGERIAGIVRSLLSFARYDNDKKHSVSIGDILSESLSVINAQLQRERIHLKMNIPPNLPAITVHFQQIEQVFLNVINNARYALKQKYTGKHKDKVLEIRGEKAIIDRRPFVRMTFYDHGTGMPEDLQNKIMNPFFTTKPRDYGTGLGLSISNSIVKQHSGSIKIASTEGEFTKIIIDLPADA